MKECLVRKLICALIAFTCSPIVTNGQQDRLKFISLNVKDGLSSNIVNDIEKDNLGYLWFATEDGLNRFDGQEFRIYRSNRNDSTSLQSNEISCVFKDRKGILWVGTYGGALSRYNQTKDNFHNYEYDRNNMQGINNTINAISDDYLGNIWVSSFGRLHILDTKKDSLRRIPNKALFGPEEESNFNVLALFEDSKNRMWLGTNEALLLYNRERATFKKIAIPETGASKTHLIRTIHEDHKGNIWIGTNHGIVRIDTSLTPDTKQMKTFFEKSMVYKITSNKNYLWVGTEDGLYVLNADTDDVQYYGPDLRDNYSLSSKSVRSIYLDREGITWVSTYRGGVHIYDKNLSLFDFKSIRPPGNFTLSGSIITSFAEKDNASIYVGTDKDGLYLFDRKSRIATPVQSFNRVNDGVPILSLLKSSSNKLWIGTFSKGLYVIDLATNKVEQILKGEKKNDISNNDIFCLIEDSRNNIWMGTNGGGIKVYSQAEKRIYSSEEFFKEDDISFNWFIRAIVEDRKGNIWMASLGNGIIQYNAHTHSVQLYEKNNSNLNTDHLQTLFVDADDNLWAGTVGDGFYRFNEAENNFENFSLNEGLANPEIYKILQDKKGLIWVSTNAGISSFDKKTKKIKNYTHHNGLQNNNFIRQSGLKTADGTLFFGGIEGFNYFNESNLKTNDKVFPVVFTDLKVNNKSVVVSENSTFLAKHISVAEQIDLSYKEDFSISYVALNFTNPQKNKYAYKLEGYDSDWNYVDATKVASYTNLGPGEYLFRVKASNSEGLWNDEGSSIRVVVHPPFWLTPLAYIFYFLTGVGILLFIRHLGIRKIEKKFQREQEELRAKQLFEQEKREVEQRHEFDKMKLKFLTNISHEFRTPISLIMAPVDKILNEKQAAGVTAQVSTIKRNARRLLNLVNQLLDFRNLEKREFNLDLQKEELVSFLREVVDSFRDLSDKKKVQLFFVSEIEEFVTYFDKDKIERIMFNLLSNAFKFTNEGGIVKVELTPSETLSSFDDKKWFTIKVKDNGIGIPEEYHDQIFGRFFQAEVNSAILNQGSGIGLSITKEFVTLHGGFVRVESVKGKGATFIVEIPLVADEAVEKEVNQFKVALEEQEGIDMDERQQLMNGEELKRPKILIVEDNDEFRYYLKESLKHNYRIIEAINGKDGWKEILYHHPELILSDINMPYMNGIELTNKVKSDKRTSHVPIILLTASTGEEAQLEGLETGANDYITKPVNFDILNIKIRNALSLNQKFKETYSKQVKVLTPEVEASSDHEKFLNKVVLYIEDNLTDSKLSVEDLSRYMNMSRSTLYHKILEITGTTPIELIRGIKLEKALALLEKSDMNVAQIAYCVGFATPNYFAKSFKAKYNMLPSEYIQMKRKVVL